MLLGSPLWSVPTQYGGIHTCQGIQFEEFEDNSPAGSINQRFASFRAVAEKDARDGTPN